MEDKLQVTYTTDGSIPPNFNNTEGAATTSHRHCERGWSQNWIIDGKNFIFKSYSQNM